MLAYLFAASLLGKILAGPAVALDGDTLMLTDPLHFHPRVYLFGLDAPAMDSHLGPQARTALDDAIAGREVTCKVVDTDNRTQPIAICSAEGADLSEAVLSAGLGTTNRSLTHDWSAEPAYAQRLDAAEAEARAAGLGLWASTATVPTDNSLWKAIINDPRAVATLIGAFLGFTLGVLIKLGVDLFLDWLRRRQARRELAAELHAEIGWVMKRVREVVQAVRQTCPADTAKEKEIETRRWQWDHWQAPAMEVREAHIGRLGTLPQAIARHLIRIGGQADWLDRRRTILMAEMDEPENRLSARSLHNFVAGYLMIMLDLLKLNAPLAKIGKVKAHNWAKAEAEMAAEKLAAEKLAAKELAGEERASKVEAKKALPSET